MHFTFQVKLTHFVALDEFYVRFESEEEQYQDMLAQLRDDYKGELEFARPQLWLKGDGAAVWFERQWQRGVVCTSIMNDAVSTLDVFLIDVGKTVTISKEQVLPLHSYYHKPPFAVCCTIGCFDIFHGRRPDLVEECKRMAEAFTTAPSESLSAEIEDKIWDDKEKLKVRLCFRKPTKRVFVPDYFVNEKIIDLR
ncbi:Tudor domain-containing protein [Trichostrongylus colubriformis]|uniref:Tudor domain-containing protein n=1 Tax=Trichostrongylus colubriformis TaxID=6319 RepID=A0AAN8FAX7_TRICO